MFVVQYNECAYITLQVSVKCLNSWDKTNVAQCILDDNNEVDEIGRCPKYVPHGHPWISGQEMNEIGKVMKSSLPIYFFLVIRNLVKLPFPLDILLT